MDHKKNWRLKNINALLIVVVVIISLGVFAFAGMTIINTDNLATYTAEIYSRPYAVNNAAWQMRAQILFARNTMLNLLLDDEYGVDAEEKLQALYKMREEIPGLEQTLQTQYEGDEETVARLISEVERLRRLHDECIELIKAGNIREAGEILYGSAYPLYSAAEMHAQELIGHSQEKIDAYVAQSYALNEQTNQLALIWGLALVALAVLLSVVSVRTITKRNGDIFRSNTLFRIISENVDDVFIVYDIARKSVEYVSDNAERILGFSPSEYRGDPPIAREYLDEKTFRRLRDHFWDAEGGEIQEELFLMTDPKTGSRRECISRRYPIVENGKITKAVFVTSDLTEQKRTQNMLRTALERAENANVAKREFLSRMSHEIRTPMNAMTGTLRAMEYDIDNSGKMKEHLRKLNMSAMHLLDLINDILDMSRIESGKIQIESRPFSLNAMLSELTDIMQTKAEENRQAFNVLLKSTSCDMVKGDDTRIKQVLLNFLSNAIKFTPPHGKIRMSVEEIERRGNQVLLKFEVRDTGIGMHEEFLKRLFEPFEQEQNSTYRKYGGTGLGMALSKALVESMGGEIMVESVPDMGSVFSFCLWLEAAGAGGSSVQISDKVKNLRVLVIEDDEEMREHLKLQCRQLGVEAEAVASGLEAVRTLRKTKRKFDLCLIDLYMPDVDGIHTAEWIRKSAGKDTFIVLMSAYDHKKIEKEAVAAGVDAFLTKPVMRADIYRVLQDMSGEEVTVSEEDGMEDYDFAGKRLLIAEDNELNMEVAQELCEHVGFEVECAYNGKIAVEMFEQSPVGYYDAILMDVHMPAMNGNEAAQTIRNLKRKDAGSVVIIAMTANAFYEDEVEALKSGMNAHMAKPIEPEAIFAALKKFLYDNREE